MLPGPPPLGPTGAAAPAAACGPPAEPQRLPVAAAVAAATGNRCGHCPSAPRFDLLNLPEDANHARPVLIGQAMLKLKAYYDSPREARWDELSQGERHHRLERAIAAAGGPDTEEGRKLAARLARWRQQRSERREAVTTVLMLLLAYTDIDTLTVAIPGGGGWLGLSVRLDRRTHRAVALAGQARPGHPEPGRPAGQHRRRPALRRPAAALGRRRLGPGAPAVVRRGADDRAGGELAAGTAPPA